MRLFIAPTAEFDHNFHSFPAPMTGLALQQGSILMTLFFAATTWTDSLYLYQVAMLSLRSSQGSTEKKKPFSHLIMVWKQVYRVCIFFFLCCEFFSVVMSLKITCRVTRLNTTLITIKLLHTTYYFMPFFLYQCEHIMAFDIYTAPNAKNSVQ